MIYTRRRIKNPTPLQRERRKQLCQAEEWLGILSKGIGASFQAAFNWEEVKQLVERVNEELLLACIGVKDAEIEYDNSLVINSKQKQSKSKEKT